jgi:hypothetical protein
VAYSAAHSSLYTDVLYSGLGCFPHGQFFASEVNSLAVCFELFPFAYPYFQFLFSYVKMDFLQDRVSQCIIVKRKRKHMLRR